MYFKLTSNSKILMPHPPECWVTGVHRHTLLYLLLFITSLEALALVKSLELAEGEHFCYLYPFLQPVLTECVLLQAGDRVRHKTDLPLSLHTIDGEGQSVRPLL